MPSKIKSAKPQITDFFERSPIKAFNRTGLAQILKDNRENWQLPAGLGVSKFLNFLVDNTKLQEITLESEHYFSETRFIWGHPSIYAIALSLKKKSYLTHGSAVFLHNLNDQIPRTIYINYEQSPKPQKGVLTQEGINRAFSNQQRQSNLTFKYDNFRIVAINGKHTNRLEVSPWISPNLESLDVTKLERTLIDITVRPAYAGGVYQVLEAFERAKDIISVNTLVATLKKLNYLYPYQQAIGFYMERAGYTENKWSRLLKLGTPFDFYITHQIAKKEYSRKWRLFYPSGL